MAAVEVLEAHDYGTRYVETSTLTTLATIAGGSFTNGDTYLILYTGKLTASSSTFNSNYLRYFAPDGSTKLTFARIEAHNNTTALTYGMMALIVADGTNAATISIEETGASTAYAADVSIVAINVTDLGIASTDYWWDLDTTNYAHTTSFVVHSSVTFTPTAADDLLIVGTVTQNVDSVSIQHEAELAKDGTRLADSAWNSSEGEDTIGQRSYLIFGVDEGVAAAETTYSVRVRDDGSGSQNNTVRSAIFVVPLNTFETHSIVAPADVTSGVATSAWTQLATVDHTPSTTGNQIILAGATFGNTVPKLRVQYDGVSDPAEPYYPFTGYDSTDRGSTLVPNVRSIDTGGETIDLDYYTTSSTADFYSPLIVAFSAELLGAAAPDTVLPLFAQIVGGL